MKKRDVLIAEAISCAIYCATTEQHHKHIAAHINFTVHKLKAMDPTFNEKEFRERCLSPF